MPSYELRCVIEAPPKVVWSVLGDDFARIDQWAPMLVADCEVLTPPPLGTGTRRRCRLPRPLAGLDTFEEEVLVWEPPRTLAYRVVDPPLPLRSVRNRWTLQELDHERTQVSMVASVEGRFKLLGALLPKRLREGRRRDLEAALDGLKREVEARYHGRRG